MCYNIENVKEQHQGQAERQSIERVSKHPLLSKCVCVLQHRQRKVKAPRRGCKTVERKGEKTSLIILCVLQHRECKRSAPRRGWKRINPKGKGTSLINYCVCVRDREFVR